MERRLRAAGAAVPIECPETGAAVPAECLEADAAAAQAYPEGAAESAAEELLSLLKARGLTLSAAESCTGGLLASTLVGIPGASAVFHEGFVTYTNRAKEHTLHVPPEIIGAYGAISAETAREMAAGAAACAGTDAAISVTGNAGPDADEGKPVGMVYVGVSYRGKTRILSLSLSGSRNEIRRESVRKALCFCAEICKEDMEERGEARC